tara:strand:- start:12605 stop:13465 length:861 start_codon:yes stop_codon:yes gene_type:complete
MVKSIEELRKICAKSKTKEEWEGRWWIARFEPRIKLYMSIVWLFLHTNISANQVTLIGLGVGVTSGLLFCLGDPASCFFASLLLQVEYNLDAVDGHIARYRGTASMTGNYFDAIVHYISETFIFLCAGFGLFVRFDSLVPLIIGVAAAFFFFLLKIAYDLKYFIILGLFLKKKIKVKEKQIVIPVSNIELEKINRQKIINPGWKIILKIFGLNPYKYLIFFNIATFLDLFIKPFIFINHQFSCFYLLIFSYAVFYFLSSVKGIGDIVVNQTIDSEFRQIFGEKNYI